MRTRGIPAAVLVVILSTLAGGMVGTQAGATQERDRATERYRIYTTALAAVETGVRRGHRAVATGLWVD